ncbi:hypothetical protein QQG55_7360 [Brugia pahangi]
MTFTMTRENYIPDIRSLVFDFQSFSSTYALARSKMICTNLCEATKYHKKEKIIKNHNTQYLPLMKT